MNTIEHHSAYPPKPSLPKAVGRGLLRFGWITVRLPVLAVLLALEPFVSMFFTAIAVLGIIVSLFLEFLANPPHFHFWLMLGLSVGFAMVPMLHRLLIRIFSTK